mmetsp:Transcript_104121/g.324646  ORF Transcript_104121/g.324646 Transcript_104121/m.324646 type:complete len:407 (-) Transcript_104121:60-1280(-)
MDRLLDVVPVHLRFNITEGASLTRNVIIRSIAAAIIPIEVTLPGPPFRITLGAERVEKGLVRLSPGETLPLRVTLDRGALPPGRPACDFIVVRVELCKPLAVDIVAVPEGMPEESVRQLIAARLKEVPGMDSVTGPAANASESVMCGSRAAPDDATRSSASQEASDAGAVPVAAHRPPPPAALAAYLGEAPSGAAVRGADALSARGSASSRRGRSACDSPDDSPEPGPRLDGRSGADDDRPPTPAPAGFETVDEGCVPLNFCGVRNSPRNRSTGSTPTGQTPVRTVAEAAPAAPTSLGSGRAPSKATAAAKAPAARQPTDVSKEGLFFIEGVGWCDEYGRTVAGLDGVRKPSPARTGPARLEATSKPRPQAKSKSTSSTNVATGLRPPKKMTPQERDAAWDALGGI